MDNLRSVSHVIVPRLRRLASNHEFQVGKAIDIGSVDHVDHVTLLAVGGYNSVFLVHLKEGIQLEARYFGDTDPLTQLSDREKTLGQPNPNG